METPMASSAIGVYSFSLEHLGSKKAACLEKGLHHESFSGMLVMKFPA